MGRSSILMPQNVIPLSWNRPPYLFTQQIQTHSPWSRKHCAQCHEKQTGELCLLPLRSRPCIPASMGEEGCLCPPPQRPTYSPAPSWLAEPCPSGQQSKDDRFFFLTDKGKDDSVKKDKPYKIFFKDLFLFKENEMAAKKKVKFYWKPNTN